jgi:single-strand DNA-binding protein
MNYAKAIIAGNLGRQPELRFLPDGTPLTSFSVAIADPPRQGATPTSGGHQSPGNPQSGSETSTWWHVSVFGRQAEACAQSLQKGSRVLVEGRPYLREYSDQEGSRRSTLELRASDVRFLDPRPTTEQAATVATSSEQNEADVPF